MYPDSHELLIGEKHVRCNRSQLRILWRLLTDFCKTVPYADFFDTDGRELSAREQNLLHVQMCYVRRLLRANGARLRIRNVYGEGYQARPSRAQDLGE